MMKGRGRKRLTRLLAVILALTAISSLMGCSGLLLWTPGEEETSGVGELAEWEPTTSGKYTPGTYTAVGQGMRGEVTVAVDFGPDAIEDIRVENHGETDGVSNAAISEIPPAILAAQSADVDAVAGATYTSDAIKYAVGEAMRQARGEDEGVQMAEEIAFHPGDE